MHLARSTVEAFVENGARPMRPRGLPEEMTSRRAGCFVSLKENGELRGCIGTIRPVRDCLAD